MELKHLAAEPPKPVRKPKGGYRLISVTQICLVWHAYQSGLIRYRDLRVWFALQEMMARRCRAEKMRSLALGLAELRGLVGGVGGKRLEACLERLEKVSLVKLGEHGVEFAVSPDQLVGDVTGFWAMWRKVANNRRRVPVPRRSVRLIAQIGRPAVVATMLGYLLRCLYVRDGGLVSDGCCKASWVADVFGIDSRNAKRARKYLAGIGWLRVCESAQWHKNRYGGRAVVNLTWRRPEVEPVERTETPPPKAVFAPVLPPPDIKQETSSSYKNQKPASAAGRPTGSLAREGKEKTPNLRHVELVDLQSTPRLVALFEQAVQAKLVVKTETGRLDFVAAAEHALHHGTLNPPGLFMHLVRKGLWGYCTNGDDDAANERLKRHLYGAAREKAKPAKAVRPRPKPVELSDDARVVVAVRRVAAERRITGDLFWMVRQVRPEWSKEHWERAIDELETARMERVLQGRQSGESCRT